MRWAFAFLSLTVLVVRPVGLAAQAKRVIERGAAIPSSPTDSLPGAALVRNDPGTGAPRALGSMRVLVSGERDATWNADSAAAFTGAASLRGRQALDGTGGRYVAWVDRWSGDGDIRLQRHTATGEIAAGWPMPGVEVCGEPFTQSAVEVASDGQGGAFVAWEDFRAGGHTDVYLQRIGPDGTPAEGWGAGGRRIGEEAGQQTRLHVQGSVNGGAVLAWQCERQETTHVMALRLSPDGSPASGWPAGGLRIAEATGPDAGPRLIAITDGVLMFWRHGARGSRSLRVARVPAYGQPVESVALSAECSEIGEVSLIPSGSDAIVAWSEWRNDQASLRAQRVGVNLIASWIAGGIEIRSGEVGRGPPSLALDESGDVLVAWEDLRDPDQSDIFMQRLSVEGVAAAGWSADGKPVCKAAGDQYAVSIAWVDGAGAIVLWDDAPTAEAGLALNASPSGRVAPQLLRATARPGRATLVWVASPRGHSEYSALRRLGRGEWTRLGVITPNDSQHVVLDDRAAPEGARVVYRLAMESPQAEVLYEEVALEIPIAPVVLALNRAFAVPGAIRLTVALPRGAEPRLELMDVAGRRVAEQRLSGLDPGEHEVRFPLSGRISAGVYFLRLIQGHEVRNAKVIYLK